MEHQYHKLLNFVTKLSLPKKSDAALGTMSRLDENKGDTALEIFENGIDQSQADIAIRARRLLQTLDVKSEPLMFTEKAIFTETSDEPEITMEFEGTAAELEVELKKDWKVESTKNIVVDEEEPNLKAIEKKHIEYWLGKCKNNKSETAKRLGISVKGLYNKISYFGISC